MSDSFRSVRIHLTAWYVGVFAVILLLFGGSLFYVATAQIAKELDGDLRAAALEVRRAVEIRERERVTAPGLPVDALEEMRIPGRFLFVFDRLGALVHPGNADEWVGAAARAALRDGEAWRTETVRGEPRWRAYAQRFTVGGEPYVAVAAADPVEIEDQYPALVASFALAALAALCLVAIGGAALARKSLVPVDLAFEQMRRFVADASHELRTPAAVLRTRAEVALQRDRTVEEYVEVVRAMMREAERLGGMVDGLLLLASADADQLAVRRQLVYLDDLLLDAATAARTLAAGKEVRVDIAGFEEAPVFADPLLARQLLTIVLENAVKYTPDGGRIEASVAASNGRCRVRVSDSGPGIPADVLPHVFERFYRADPARSRAGGSGLGLAIARVIADAHGALIALDSREGHGTTVLIDFPRALISS